MMQMAHNDRRSRGPDCRTAWRPTQWIGVVASFVLATPIGAQPVTLASTLSAVRARDGTCGSQKVTGGELAATARSEWPLASLSATGVLTSAGSSIQAGAMRAEVSSPEWKGWRARIASGVDPVRRCAPAAIATSTAGALSYSTDGSGWWLGYDATPGTVSISPLASSSQGDSTSPPRTTRSGRAIVSRGTIVIGAWRRIGSAMVSFSVGRERGRYADSALVTHIAQGFDSVYSDTTHTYVWVPAQHAVREWKPVSVRQDAMAPAVRALWTRGRIALDVTTGGWLGTHAAFEHPLWATGRLALALTPVVSAIGEFASGGVPSFQAAAPGRQGMVGLQLALGSSPGADRRAAAPAGTGASAFRVHPEESGTYAVTVWAPFARLVELAGDFAEWQPIHLQRAASGWWEARVRLTSGIHRVSLRIDGGRWTAPPGTPRQHDEFGGDVGILVIP